MLRLLKTNKSRKFIKRDKLETLDKKWTPKKLPVTNIKTKYFYYYTFGERFPFQISQILIFIQLKNVLFFSKFCYSFGVQWRKEMSYWFSCVADFQFIIYYI